MTDRIVAVFPCRKDEVAAMEEGFRASLGDTRAYDGCLDIEVTFEAETSTFVVIQEWESVAHYDRYLAWRVENGLYRMFDRVLEGGHDAFRVYRLGKKPEL
ncbi:MAG: antibiotic biosynthesis monooxygenase [Gammaproteobacteria bacterium]|nr:antibiotic biosynthesis monooxygenase [Gammaproteobacteria bacterium]|tara:strand:+ start:1160 stop:1462 length:303 start_codon:yes stop_codon:yes gene_type:complete